MCHNINNFLSHFYKASFWPLMPLWVILNPWHWHDPGSTSQEVLIPCSRGPVSLNQCSSRLYVAAGLGSSSSLQINHSLESDTSSFLVSCFPAPGLLWPVQQMVKMKWWWDTDLLSAADKICTQVGYYFSVKPYGCWSNHQLS